MKRVILAVMVLAAAMNVAACKTSAKSKTTGKAADKLVILVMDSTKALLPEAEMTVGKETLRTSFDGRIELSPEQVSANKKATIRCEGYQPQTIRLNEAEKGRPLVVTMVEKPTRNVEKSSKHGTFAGVRADRGDGKRTKLLYSPMYGVSVDEAAYMSPDIMLASDEAAMTEAAIMDEAAATKSAAGVGPAANGVSAGKLTAGEVNDFARWEFWQTVLDKTHKQYVSTWRIEARERKTVQLADSSGYPLANVPVSWLDEKGNTVFLAVTDNTGKAELWRVKAKGERANGEGLQIRVEDKSIAVKKGADGLNRVVLDGGCPSEAVDVMFVFDATGSMGDELRYLQAEMKDVISRAEAATGGLKIRTGAVVYRDHGDEYITRLSRLTADISETQRFIDKQEAMGGGDYPEAVPEALMATLNSAGWDENARTRIAFLILDAPCHEDSATVALLNEQVLNAAAQGVRIVPVVCSGIGESGELLMRSIALVTNGTSFFLSDDSGIGEKHLKPTTDSWKIEHLNDMMVRTIVEFSAMPECGAADGSGIADLSDDGTFVPNPFEAKDLDSTVVVGPELAKEEAIRVLPNPCSVYCVAELPNGADALYLVDISGKVISRVGRRWEPNSRVELPVESLPIGIYFVKVFVGGRWYTQKVLKI